MTNECRSHCIIKQGLLVPINLFDVFTVPINYHVNFSDNVLETITLHPSRQILISTKLFSPITPQHQRFNTNAKMCYWFWHVFIGIFVSIRQLQLQCISTWHWHRMKVSWLSIKVITNITTEHNTLTTTMTTNDWWRRSQMICHDNYLFPRFLTHPYYEAWNKISRYTSNEPALKHLILIITSGPTGVYYSIQ